jgi:hypothetical protein
MECDPVIGDLKAEQNFFKPDHVSDLQHIS